MKCSKTTRTLLVFSALLTVVNCSGIAAQSGTSSAISGVVDKCIRIQTLPRCRVYPAQIRRVAEHDFTTNQPARSGVGR